MSKVVVIHGDSITDAGRSRENIYIQGNGYARLVSGELTGKHPGEYVVYNRGNSGNRIVDTYRRSLRRIIKLKPDYFSLLIGVNDVWHEYTEKNGVSAEKFEKIYDLVLSELLEELPNLKMMLLEPFVLPGAFTENTEEHPARWEYFQREVALRSQAVARLAKKYDVPFVPLQEMLNQAHEKHPYHWTRDGVHPTPAGHELIKRQWLKYFETIR